jgi:hypothetical protein
VVAVWGSCLVRTAAACLGCLILAGVLAGCEESSGAGGTASRPSTASARPSAPSGTRSELADRAAVEAAYRRFWSVSDTFERSQVSAWRGLLAQVAVDPQLGLILASAREQRRNSLIIYGHVVPRPTVLPIDGADRARVTDCQDASKSGQADLKTGRPRTVGIPRNPVTAVLVRGADGRWRVSSISYPGGTC